ncbi:hypothetical protein GJ496_008463 [Pomphorhynchus laevis]|nr:hypothetical protein GJ496_008463 [Pomphorhynchus laevis]
MRWKCKRLYELTSKKVKWEWTGEHHNEWIQNVDEKSPLKLMCNACEVGLGAVLMQNKSKEFFPIAYASRLLSSSEQRYAQIDREALALVFAVQQFNHYLAGRKFTLQSDHKPLKYIMGEHRDLQKVINHRLVRYVTILNQYDYDLEYVTINDNYIADALSRLPSARKIDKEAGDNSEEESFINLIQSETMDVTDMSSERLKDDIDKDCILKLVRRNVNTQWPLVIESNIKPYFAQRHMIEVEAGILLMAGRIIVPINLRTQVMRMLHQGHLGIVLMKSLVRFYVWWPGITSDIEKWIARCEECQGVRHSEPNVPLQPWSIPDKEWERIHMDFAGPHNGKYYLIVQCALTKWPEVIPVTTITATIVINKLRTLFARWGVPGVVVSDNDPPFSSDALRQFLKNNGINHIRTAPYHPKSNGLAERFVRVFKQRVLKHQGELNLRLQQFLISYQRQKYYHDQKSRPRSFVAQNLVWYCRDRGQRWEADDVIKRTSANLYEIRTRDGRRVRTHVDQLRKRIDRCTELAQGDRNDVDVLPEWEYSALDANLQQDENRTDLSRRSNIISQTGDTSRSQSLTENTQEKST